MSSMEGNYKPVLVRQQTETSVCKKIADNVPLFGSVSAIKTDTKTYSLNYNHPMSAISKTFMVCNVEDSIGSCWDVEDNGCSVTFKAETGSMVIECLEMDNLKELWCDLSLKCSMGNCLSSQTSSSNMRSITLALIIILWLFVSAYFLVQYAAKHYIGTDSPKLEVYTPQNTHMEMIKEEAYARL